MPKKVTLVNDELLNFDLKDPFVTNFGSWDRKKRKLAYEYNNDIPVNITIEDVKYKKVSSTDSIADAFYKVEFNVSPTGDDNKFRQAIGSIVLDRRYYDYATEITMPDEASDVFDANADSNTAAVPAVGVQMEYLRENIALEDTVSDVTDEKMLVNYYEPQTEGISNRNSLIKMAKAALLQDAAQRTKYTNVIIPPESVENINETNTLIRNLERQSYDAESLDYTSELAYCARVSMKDTNGSIEQAQELVKVANNLMFFPEIPENPSEGDIGTLLMRWHAESPETFVQEGKYVAANPAGVATNKTYESYSLLEWLNGVAPASVGDLDSGTSVVDYVRDPAASTDLAINNYDNKLKFTRALSTVAQKYIDEFLAGNAAKRVEDSFVGKLGSSEILYYKVDKFEGNSSTGTPLQTFYVPNTAENIEYIDSQVIYGREYTYVINYVVAIHGCSYEYKNLRENDDGTYKLVAHSYPELRVVVVPAFIRTAAMLSPPPMVPEFEILPIRRQENRVKIVFYSRYGSEVARPMTLQNADGQLVNRYLRNGYMNSRNGELVYESRVTNEQFTIFTTSRPPQSETDYRNFRDNVFATVSTRASDSDLLADSAAVVLELKPNKKYYLTATAKTRLGMSSNPTGIFEIMYINKDGISRIEYGEYTKPDVREESSRETKSLTKFVNIRPVFAQVTPNLEKSKLADADGELETSKGKEVFLGVKEDSLFGGPGVGKKFKFRFRSKNTNKAFDLNVTCVNTKVESEFSREDDSIKMAPEFDQLTQEDIETARERSNPGYPFGGAVQAPTQSPPSSNSTSILVVGGVDKSKKVVASFEEDVITNESGNSLDQQSEQITDLFPSGN